MMGFRILEWFEYKIRTGAIKWEAPVVKPQHEGLVLVGVSRNGIRFNLDRRRGT